MRFAQPELLWWLLSVPVFVGFGILWSLRRRRRLARFAGDPETLPRFIARINPHARILKAILLSAALVFGVLASARPQIGSRMEKVTRTGIDVMLLVDTSLSMACEDVAPNRFERAKFAAESLIRKIPGDRVGLVTFAGTGVLNCPMTLDHGAIGMFMDAVGPQESLVSGTALADALGTARTALLGGRKPEPDGGAERGKAVVLFSDGEDHEAGLEPELAALKAHGIRLYSIGVGTGKGGPIPVHGEEGGISGYKKDRLDRIVTTRLNETLLREAAENTGGAYWKATGSENEIDRLVEELSGLAGGELGTVLRTRYEERFQIPLLLAFLALFGEMMIPDRIKETKR